MSTLLIRADASSQMGTGHVMRCLALAQTWQVAGGDALFLMAESTPALISRLADEGIEIQPETALSGSAEDADECAARYRDCDAELLVVDGYHFHATFQRRLKHHGVRVLAFDDYGHAADSSADFVLNQTNCAHENLYHRRAAHVRLLLGTKYVSFRREFWPWVGHKRTHPARVRHILVTLGGSDPNQVTMQVIDALRLARLDGCQVTIVLGAGNAHVQQVAEHFENSELRGRVVVNAASMPELMAAADLTITAGGSTVWELALLGLPCISLVLAKNQERCLADLEARGAILNLGWPCQTTTALMARAIRDLAENRPRRVAMAGLLSSYVDGQGAQRVLDAVAEASRDKSASGRAA